MTAAIRRPGLIAAFALAVAASVAATPASASGSPALASGAKAPATKSQGPQASGGSGGSLPRTSTSITRANTTLPPPRHHGTLRITGSLRDGGTVRAAGLSWRPGKLPPGDRLLSFEIGYYWDACTAAAKCIAGAGTTVTPFAGRRYLVGHADTSR